MRLLRSAVLVAGSFVTAVHPSFAQVPGPQSGPAAQANQQGELVAPPAWLYNDLACAPRLSTDAPGKSRVLGSQDTVIKMMMGPGDTVVVSGGTGAGMQPGQQYFIRRRVKTPDEIRAREGHPVSVHTAGWVQIIGVDSSIATATIVHACDGILLDDYLEPFSPPMITAHPVPGSKPQYTNMGRVMLGDEASQNVALGQMIGIDRGSKDGATIGQRYLVFRDKRAMRFDTSGFSPEFAANAQQQPLVEVGEVVVVAVRPADSTVQVVVAKDTIATGDFIAEIR